MAVAKAALEMASVDELGLDKQDRAYLKTIISAFGGGPAGIEAVAHTMNLSPDTLSDEVEPYLLRTELVIRTPRGRVVTAKAYGHLQMDAPKVGEGQGTLLGSFTHWAVCIREAPPTNWAGSRAPRSTWFPSLPGSLVQAAR